MPRAKQVPMPHAPQVSQERKDRRAQRAYPAEYRAQIVVLAYPASNRRRGDAELLLQAFRRPAAADQLKRTVTAGRVPTGSRRVSAPSWRSFVDRIAVSSRSETS